MTSADNASAGKGGCARPESKWLLRAARDGGIGVIWFPSTNAGPWSAHRRTCREKWMIMTNHLRHRTHALALFDSARTGRTALAELATMVDRTHPRRRPDGHRQAQHGRHRGGHPASDGCIPAPVIEQARRVGSANKLELCPPLNWATSLVALRPSTRCDRPISKEVGRHPQLHRSRPQTTVQDM